MNGGSPAGAVGDARRPKRTALLASSRSATESGSHGVGLHWLIT